MKLPPSLKLSGVTFRIPKMVGRCDFDGQAKLTPGLPPVLRRGEASTAWDALPASSAPVRMAAGPRAAAAVAHHAPARRLRHRSEFRGRGERQRLCVATACAPAAPLSHANRPP